MQILSFIRTAWGQGLTDPEPTNLEKCLNQSQGEGHISYLHTCIYIRAIIRFSGVLYIQITQVETKPGIGDR